MNTHLMHAYNSLSLSLTHTHTHTHNLPYRYTLLLRDLLKHLPADHPDFASLSESLDQFGEKAVMLNVKKKEAEVDLSLSLLSLNLFIVDILFF